MMQKLLLVFLGILLYWNLGTGSGFVAEYPVDCLILKTGGRVVIIQEGRVEWFPSFTMSVFWGSEDDPVGLQVREKF